MSQIVDSDPTAAFGPAEAGKNRPFLNTSPQANLVGAAVVFVFGLVFIWPWWNRYLGLTNEGWFQVFGTQYRLVPPDEVLYRLNRDLIDQQLSEHPFITMVYGLYSTAERTLAFARAGHPYPLLVPAKGEPRFLEVHGTLLGVFETEFIMRTEPLQPGDKVLFYTDGLETADVTARSLLTHVPQYRDQPIDAMVSLLADDLVGEAGLADDLTLLGLEVVE